MHCLRGLQPASHSERGGHSSAAPLAARCWPHAQASAAAGSTALAYPAGWSALADSRPAAGAWLCSLAKRCIARSNGPMRGFMQSGSACTGRGVMF